MNIHKVACAVGASVRAVYKWRKPFLDHGLGGLQDRSSKPEGNPARTPQWTQFVRLRRARRIMNRIAAGNRASRATVGPIPTGQGFNRWRDLKPAEPVVRYERDTSGDLIHNDP